jgi:ABC-type phosphate/phosphonate transport system substrate-binding protein
MRAELVAFTSLVAVAMAAPRPAHAGPKDFVVYVPEMGGDSQVAKPYLEQFLGELEKRMGWIQKAGGQYFVDRKAAEDYISGKDHPAFGMLTPALYLDLACKKEPMELVARVLLKEGNNAGKYHVVVKSDSPYKALDGLKGKRLSSNHLQNARFISNVIFAGRLDAEKQFQLQPTPSPIKPFKQVDRGEADAALIDDAQLANMKKLPFGQSLRVIYSSESVPAYPVVAFTKVTKPADREAMRKVVLSLCQQKSQVCDFLQITKFETIDANAYRVAQEQYCKP